MNIEEIKAREQAATRGPWKAELSEGDCGKIGECPKGLEYCNDNCQKCEYWEISRGAWPHGPESVECGDYCFFTDTDAEFICHARTDIPALLAEVERLQKIVKLQKASCSLVETVKSGNILAENATLKKQTGLMAKYIVEQGNVDMNLCDDIPNVLHLKYQPQNDGNYPNEPCIQCVQEYFRQQAEQRPDEVTHGEAEK